MLISWKRSPSVIPPIILNGSSLSVVKEHKQLGLTISHQLTWTSQINNITSKCNRIIGMLTRYKYLWSRSALEVCYISYIRPILNMLILYMTSALLKIARNLNLYKLLLLDLLLVQKKHISSIFIQRAGVDDFRNKKEYL